ncbi:glycosyltransferase [Streptomyces sp. SID13726]|uniref:glycosyltransferase n=1 Tax=Streptomyces sp. SID13726 TaxID=2706058 RepID=UPI0013BA28B9|nr:glycosyltransferase [Streptomyces sp. SID13726]NEB05067.1 glycosyltransferase family 1 protein [Streptomyces sp. SID13726]
MRVVLSTYGSRGDVEPMAGVAVALRALGAEARVCAPPDEEFAERLAGLGVELVPVGPSVRAQMAGGPPSASGLAERAAALAAAQFEAVAAAAEDADAVVATGLFPAAAGASSAAEKLGLPYAFAAFFPSLLPSPHFPPFARPGQNLPAGETDNRVLNDLDARFLNEVFGTGLNAHRARVGMPPVTDVRDHVVTGRPWLAADPVLGPWPEPADLDVVQTGAWLLPDERPLPAGLEEFLAAGEPPVYVGFGSMPLHGSGDASQVAVDAVRAQGRRVLVARGWAGLAPADGADDCFVVGEANHRALFRRVAAVVHHGGAGTTTMAALAGAPQVIVPQMVDQPYWARRVAELGIGAAHDGPVPTRASLSAALATALADRTRVRAAEVAAMIRTDGAEVAAGLLLDLVAEREAPLGSG